MNIPEGWPTEEMIDKGWKAFHEQYCIAHNRPEAGIRAAFDAMLAAAPTSPAQTIPLETLIAELEEDPEMKIALDEARTEIKLAPPPAQEDEPESYLKNCTVICRSQSDKPMFRGVGNKVFCHLDGYTILPTEQSYELRKAAEELVRIYFNADQEREEGVSFAARMIELRAALEKK